VCAGKSNRVVANATVCGGLLPWHPERIVYITGCGRVARGGWRPTHCRFACTISCFCQNAFACIQRVVSRRNVAGARPGGHQPARGHAGCPGRAAPRPQGRLAEGKEVRGRGRHRRPWSF
jgi:hypothetical protein